MPRRQAEIEPVRGVFEKPEYSGIWWIRYTDGSGRYKREKVGRRSDAIALYHKRKEGARLGQKMPDNIRHRGITFGTLADSVIEYSKVHHKDTRNVEQRIRSLKDEFGLRVAADITPNDIDTFLTSLKRTPATANRYRATISLVYREAIRNGKVSHNPARLVKQRRENNARTRFLTRDEERRLRDAITELFPDHLAELTISLRTGMRLSEQYGLTWSQVDIPGKQINLKDTKNGTSRTIPMSASVVEAFGERWALTSDHTGKGQVFSINEPRKWFASAMKAAGLTDYRWHDNRHTFCSRLAESGAGVYTIMKLAGHKTISMSARYTHMSDGTLAGAIAQLD
jgi:integrase